MSLSSLNNGFHAISNDIGILKQIIKLSRLNEDPNLISYGIVPCNTLYLNGENFGGKGSGCGYSWEPAILGTIGETLERYAPAFHNKEESIFGSYASLKKKAIHPSEFALFHDKQFEDERFKIKKFDENVEVSWYPTLDLTTGEEAYIPGQFIYIPFTDDKNYLTGSNSTGLSAHTNYHEAILGGLYESLERDSFTITWYQNITPPKIKISADIRKFIDDHHTAKYEWHFFDVTYDLKTPTVLGICIGEAEFGKFLAIGSASRQTYGEATRKVVQEIDQAVPYFRHLLDKFKKWDPDDDYIHLLDFDKHAIFYTKRPDLWHVFDNWRNAIPTKDIDFNQKRTRDTVSEIRYIVQNLKDKGYNVLVKDVTTPDLRQLGFYSLKTFVPQLIQLAGAYPIYFLGGKRLYEVPKKMGYKSHSYDELNKYPHPFP
ncbi:YcaO-like family protein [Aureivirga sp. CE67]|uniref:YcaO-like family protein n=1 Tax=Aureivirga sp. CE67 TaxID=1788983 RepID=UPI0018C978B3|nr:YcaO-like family protein [Aureivirga sp. CE67]